MATDLFPNRNLFIPIIVSPIPEISPSDHDSLSAMCQQVTQGLNFLSNNDDFEPTTTISITNTVSKQLFTSTTTTTLQGRSPVRFVFIEIINDCIVLLIIIKRSFSIEQHFAGRHQGPQWPKLEQQQPE